MTVKEVARVWKVSESTVRRYCLKLATQISCTKKTKSNLHTT